MPENRLGLNRQALWLLAISGIFTLSVGLSNTFVNIYLWKVDRSFRSIGWYNLLVYVAIPIAFMMAGWIAKHRNAVFTLRLGIGLHAGFYLLSLIGGTTVARLPGVLGVVMGAAAGSYWLSFNMLSFKVSESTSRERFYGLNGVMGAVAGMVAPFVAGYVIQAEDRFNGISGYHVIFGLSLGLFVLAVFVSARLKDREKAGPIYLKQALSRLRVRPWRMLLLGCFSYGAREGVFLFLIGLLMYIATGSELRLGEFLLLQSGLSTISFYAVSRFVKPTWRLWVLGIGAFGMAGAAILFLLPLHASLIVLYGSVIALVLPLFLVTLQGIVFDGINAIDPERTLFMEHIIVREALENAGRVTGIAVFLLLIAPHPTGTRIAYFAFALGLVQIITWILLWRGGSVRFGLEGGNSRGKVMPGIEQVSTVYLRNRVRGS